MVCLLAISFFFFHDTATTEIYTLSLHDALPIYMAVGFYVAKYVNKKSDMDLAAKGQYLTFRSEERFSRNAETDLVCRLLLEKKKKAESKSQTTRSTESTSASA